jgi:hypothetical protein
MAAVPEDDLPNSLRGTSVPKDDLPASSVPSLEEPSKPKPPSLMERGRQVVGSALTGTGVGLVAPELVTGAGIAASSVDCCWSSNARWKISFRIDGWH